MIILRKMHFTLLEVLIALALTMLVLTTLITGYYQAVVSSNLWHKMEVETFQRRFLSHRLTDVFGHLEKKHFFATDGLPGMTLPGTPTLVFTYNNGSSKSKSFSGHVLARLFVDANGRLTLLTWPGRQLWDEHQLPPFHREVLSEDVTHLSLEFFRVKSDEHKEAGWIKEMWQKEWKETPGVIKIALTLKGNQTFTYLFPVPKTLSTVRFAL